jgi:hypothetical protein
MEGPSSGNLTDFNSISFTSASATIARTDRVPRLGERQPDHDGHKPRHTPGDPGPQREERLRGDLAALLAGLPETDQACSVARERPARPIGASDFSVGRRRRRSAATRAKRNSATSGCDAPQVPAADSAWTRVAARGSKAP